jgi:hypothetical protein
MLVVMVGPFSAVTPLQFRLSRKWPSINQILTIYLRGRVSHLKDETGLSAQLC